MSQRDLEMATRVASRYLSEGRSKTAGEVRFIKDDGELKRSIPPDFVFRPKSLKDISRVAWSLSVSMGHLISASQRFNRVKSINVSPDGRLGGKGYVQNISAMRTGLSESIETLSAVIDTLHDEIRAPHWNPDLHEDLTQKDKAEIEEMIEDSNEILENPENYDSREYQEDVVEDAASKA